MKKLILLFLIIVTISGYSQNDSTIISFDYLENEDLRLMNELNGIQMFSLICSDTLMANKRFFLSIAEYNLGKLSKIDSLGLTCEEQRHTMVVGTDTMIYVMNSCNYIEYSEPEKEFKIRFAGKYENDSLKLIIKYPYIGIKRKLKGTKDYSLREIISTENSIAKIKTKTKVPIIAYTAPFETGSGINSYCLLDSESPEAWYDKFQIKHFYIFYLEIY